MAAPVRCLQCRGFAQLGELSLTRVTKSYLLALGTTQISSCFTKHCLSVHTSTKRFYRKGTRRTRKNKERRTNTKEKPVVFGRYPVYAVSFGRYPVSAVPFGRYPVSAVPFGRYPVLAVLFERYRELAVLFWRD